MAGDSGGEQAQTRIEERLLAFLPEQRWFASKGKQLARAAIWDEARLPGSPYVLALVRTTNADGSAETYFVPLVCEPDVELDEQEGPVRDALQDDGFCLALFSLLTRGDELPGANGWFSFHRVGAEPAPAAIVRQLSAEQSNTSVVYDERLILKMFRKLSQGTNPDLEVTRFLSTRTSFEAAPGLVAYAEYASSGGFTTTLGMLQTFVQSEGDAWSMTLSDLGALLAEQRPGRQDQDRAITDTGQAFLESMGRLGRRAAQLHLALASDPDDPEFAPEPVSEWDTEVWSAAIMSRLENLLANLKALAPRLTDEVNAQVEWLSLHQECFAPLPAALRQLAGSVAKIRHHGDFHLGQVIKTGNDFVILDFEGPPAWELEERRAKNIPLRDVAGMLRSFDYAAAFALRSVPAEDVSALRPIAEEWQKRAAESFVDAYLKEAGAAPFLPASREQTTAVVAAFQLEKAVYEADYELNNRPDWLPIPLGYLVELGGQLCENAEARPAGS